MRSAWWRGSRGEWYVVAQFGLGALIFLGPRSCTCLPAFPRAPATLWIALGACLIAVGAAILIAAVCRIGAGLTALPYPKDGATLTETGPYRFVRHPMYAGVILSSLGWALAVRGVLTLLFVAALFALLDAKSRREERWLAERHPSYAAYRKRVRRLIPFVY